MSKRKHVGHGTHDFAETGSLEKAISKAWDDAKENGETEPGKYKVEIFVEVENPIRSYTVTIVPVD